MDQTDAAISARIAAQFEDSARLKLSAAASLNAPIARAGTPLAELADVAIVTPAGRYADRVQELHIKVIHILIELVERRLAPDNYKGTDAASR